MKVGLTVDSEGEDIDYNKVDTALKSVGISLKDAQGQFRDFDDVIFELSEKWDGLDKNTQRYIATIMAGNRQQSRFIALVDNWERLSEVSDAAYNSEDAGLLQYSKTLDSLETKLNNIKTSFQQFYMSIFNGEFFKGAVDIINNFVQSLSRVGPLLGTINLLQLINQIKLIGSLLINSFSKSISKVHNANKEWQNAFTQGWTPVGERIADALAAAILKKASGVGKEFVNRVKAETENTTGTTPASGQNQQQPSQQQNNPAQAYSIKALGKASQILHTWSPLTASALGEYGAVQDRTSIFGNANPDEVNEAYQKQAEIILNAGDQFGEAAKKWANRVQEAGKNFGEDVDDAAKQEGLKELNAADTEAQKEIASAEAVLAKVKAAQLKAQVGTGLMTAGTALSSAGMMMDQSTMKGYDTSTGLQAAGSALSAIGQAATGNYVGAAITAITTVVTTFQRISERAKAELENAEKAVESANVVRAEKKEELRSLSDYAKKLREVEAARFDSNEAEEEWLNLNNEIAEKYPELISYIDSEGNSIVNLTADYDGLTTARLEAAEATALYYREQQKLYKLKANAAKQSTAEEITTSPWDMHNVLFYGNTDTQAAFQSAYKKLFNQTEEGNINLDPEGGHFRNLTRLHEIGALDDFILRTFGLTEEEMLSLLDSWNGDEPALSAESYRDISAKNGLALIKRLLAEGYQPGNYFASHAARDQPFTIRGIKKLLGDELMPDEEAAAILEEYETEGISAIISRGVGLYDLVQAASSGDLELAQIARSIGTSAGVLEYSSETNSWGLSSDQDKIQQWKDVEQYAMLSESNARAWASSEGAIYLYNTAAQETLTAINGYEEILLNRAIILAGGADKLESFIEGGIRVDGQLVTLEDVYTTYAEEVATWYSGLSSANQELLQSLLSSSTSYTLKEMQNSLGKMGLSESENPEIYKAIMQTWYTDNYTAKYRGMKAIWGDTIEVMSFDQWKASDRYGERQAGLTDEGAYYQYTQGILNQLETDDIDLKNILQTASLQQQNQFISWWKVQKELIEKSEGYAVNIINARLAEVTNATKQLLDEQDTILNLGESSLDISTLDQEARMTLFNLLTSENLGTSESIDEIINFLVSQGIVVDETVRKVLENWVYENINTRIATLIDDVDNFVKQLSDLSSKQEKGLTFAESESYLKQLQKLKPNTSWNNYFKIDEKGLITFIDFGTSLKELYQAQIEQYNNETKYLNNYILKSLGFNEETNIFGSSSLDSVLEDADLTNILNYAGEGISAAEEDLRNALKQANFKDSDIDFIIQQIKSGHFKTKEDIDNYFKELSANITSGTDYLIAQYQASLQDLGFTNATKAYTDNTQIKSLLEGGSVADLQNLWLKNLDDNTSVTVDGKALEYKSGEWDDRYWEQYYTNKMSELQGAHFDAYGQLIITDYIAYAKYIAALQNWSEEDDAYKNLMQNARSAQISAQEAASVGIQTGLEELYTAAIQEQEISWSEISNIMSAANLDTETQAEILTAYENAKRQGVAGYVAFIDYLTKTIQENSNGNELDLAALQATKKDAQNALVSSLVSSLEQGFKGTLSNADFNALIEQIGGAPEAYRKYVTETYEGLRLSTEGVLAITSQLINKFGDSSAVIKNLVSSLAGGDVLGTYDDVKDAIAAMGPVSEDWTEAERERLAILQQMLGIYSQMATDPKFDFMNYDEFDGSAENWETFTSNVSTAADLLKTAFTSGEKVDYTQMNSMLTWMSSMSDEGMNTKIGNTTVTLQEFQNALLTTIDASGKVDVSAAAASLGVSMEDMATAMDGGIKELADQQIAYWTNYLQFLEGVKKLQEASENLTIEPPKLNLDGSAEYKGTDYDNLQAATTAYYNDLVGALSNVSFEYNGKMVNPFADPKTGIFASLFKIDPTMFTVDDDGVVTGLVAGAEAKMHGYMQQFYRWYNSAFISGDITKYINKETGEIIIPWDEIFTLEVQTPTVTAEINYTDVLDLNLAKEVGQKVREVVDAEVAKLKSEGAEEGAYIIEVEGQKYTIHYHTDGTTQVTVGVPEGEDIVADLETGTAQPTNSSETGETLGNEAATAVFEAWGFKPDPSDPSRWVYTYDGLTLEIKLGAESSVKIDIDKDNTEIEPPDFTTLLADWSTETGEDGGIIYVHDSGLRFKYNATTESLEIAPPESPEDPDIANVLTNWTPTKNESGQVTGYVYKNGLVFSYNPTTKALVIGLPELAPADLTAFLAANGWTSSTTGEGDGSSTVYTSTKSLTFAYGATTNPIVLVAPTEITDLTSDQILSALTNNGKEWNFANGVYSCKTPIGTVTYNINSGAINIDPSTATTGTTPTTAELLTNAFGAEGEGWNLVNGQYQILDSQGEILFSFSSAINLNPTNGGNVTVNNGKLSTEIETILKPLITEVTEALSKLNGSTVEIKIGVDRSSPVLNSSLYTNLASTIATGSKSEIADSYMAFQNGFSGSLSFMSQEDLVYLKEMAKLAQSNFNPFGGKAGESDAWWEANNFISNIDALLANPSENTGLEPLTTLATSFSNPNLLTSFTALANLLTALANPALATLDLSTFIQQINSLEGIELDEEEILAMANACTSLITQLERIKQNYNTTVSVDTSYASRRLSEFLNKKRTITIDVQYRDGGDGEGDGETPPTGGTGNYAGTVSGLAYAKGNATEKLLRGASLAGKTLVGELGPELAVYNNKYHLLGQNGAEFVDLPNDAIVFNHRQTEGIIRGQAGYRGKALVNGNVEGPAAASGIDAAIESVKEIIALWTNLKNASLQNLLDASGGGGGGSGNTIKAVNEELQEWYNLTRKIANIEQEINNLVAERANILEKDGAAYLRSLREEQRLTNDQIALQKTLLDYQELQLQRQADQINQNKIWSQFLEVDENGLLQYRKGNELNGGKGALEVLQQLNEMSGEAQVDYITDTLGYSYTNQDGEELEGEDLVKQFFQELQDQIDQYDALYDTVHETEQTLESLKSQIEEINKEIEQNQMDLEQAIYDIIVEAWEAQIEHMEEQMELVEEANENYIDSLSEALQKERDIYAQNESIADREKLQRQLSLLRRSGGSASEIADLETQLDDLLQEEYFNKQEKMIEDIQKASEEQLRKLEEQITLQEEALEYQRENGVLWTKVYEVMSGSAADILAFMQGNSTGFFSQSLLQQEQMLTDWAHKIGIYDENKKYQGYRDYATAAVWDNGAIWGMENMDQHKTTYDKLSAEQAATVRNQFANEYAASRLSGADHDTALQTALEKIKETLSGFKSQQEAPEHDVPVNNGGTSEETAKKGYYSQKYTITFTDGGDPATKSGSGAGDTEAQAKANAQWWAKKNLGSRTGTISYGKVQFYAYSQGGLVDYTGLAMVHGKPGKPESFLNAEQTKLISDSLKLNSGDGVLDSIRTTLAQLNTAIKSIINNNTNEISSFTVAPGAVTINVAELNDSYDVEELSKDVMNRMVAIASKSTSRGVNRR